MRLVLTLVVFVFAAGIWATEATFSCATAGVGNFHADPDDCHMFYQCDEWGRIAHHHMCPPGTVFDAKSKACHPEWQKPDACMKKLMEDGLKTDAVTFVKFLEIKQDFKLFSANSHAPNLATNKAQGLVSDGGLVSFVNNLTGQNKKDVLDSTLLAEKAASHKYNRMEDTENWYKFYLEVMGKVGWNMQGFRFRKYQSKQSSFKISQVALELLSGILAGDAALMLVVKETIASLAKSPEGLEVFGSKSSSDNAGNFQVLPCTADKSGQVSIAFLGSHFKAHSSFHNYFFFTWGRQSIDLFIAAQTMTLNVDVYSSVRDEIKKKLGKNAYDAIKDLDIS